MMADIHRLPDPDLAVAAMDDSGMVDDMAAAAAVDFQLPLAVLHRFS